MMNEDNGKIVPMTANPAERIRSLEKEMAVARAAAAEQMAEREQDAKDAEVLGDLSAAGIEQKSDNATLYAVTMQEFAYSCERSKKYRQQLAEIAAALRAARKIIGRREQLRQNAVLISKALAEEEAGQLSFRADIKKHADDMAKASVTVIPEVPASDEPDEPEDKAKTDPLPPGAKP